MEDYDGFDPQRQRTALKHALARSIYYITGTHREGASLYVNCDELIKEANILYNIVKDKELHKDDKHYINSMNKYINTYKNFREIKIRQYIADLKYICEG